MSIIMRGINNAETKAIAVQRSLQVSRDPGIMQKIGMVEKRMITRKWDSEGVQPPNKIIAAAPTQRASISNDVDCAVVDTMVLEAESVSLHVPNSFTEPITAVCCPDCDILCLTVALQYHYLAKHVDLGGLKI
jgi:hypothetical protein